MSEKLLKLVDELAEAADEANHDFDELAFREDRFPVGGDCAGTYLAVNLEYLRDELNALALDLRTIGEPR